MQSITAYLDGNIQSCTKCTLVQSVKGLGFGRQGKFMVVDIAPRKNQGGFILSEKGNKETSSVWWLWKCLYDVQWPIKETYFTSLLKCPISDKQEPVMDFTCLKLWFSQEVMAVVPTVIICLGIQAYKLLASIKVWYSDNIEIRRVHHYEDVFECNGLFDEWKNQWLEILAINRSS